MGLKARPSYPILTSTFPAFLYNLLLALVDKLGRTHTYIWVIRSTILSDTYQHLARPRWNAWALSFTLRSTYVVPLVFRFEWSWVLGLGLSSPQAFDAMGQDTDLSNDSRRNLQRIRLKAGPVSYSTRSIGNMLIWLLRPAPRALVAAMCVVLRVREALPQNFLSVFL
jgi:hypothetical protein